MTVATPASGIGLFTPVGVAMVVVAGVAALALAFFGRARLPAAVVAAALAACGAGIGLGAAWIEVEALREGESLGAQRLAAVAIAAVLTPLHVRAVFGPLGKRG